MADKEVMFHQWNCKVLFGKYSNGATAIRLFDVEDGQPVATATINLIKEDMFAPQFKSSDELEPNQCYLKNYAECEGMLATLGGSRIVKYTGISIPLNQYGDVAPLVEILD